MLRFQGILGVMLIIFFAWDAFDIILPFTGLAIVLAGITFLNGLTWLRLRQPWPVIDQEMFFQLIVDVLGLSLIIYLSGGSTNPFISLLLLPLILAATLLPTRYSLFMAVITILCYTALLYWYVPLSSNVAAITDLSNHEHSQISSFQLHVLGMWFNFVISAGLIATVAVKMRETIHNRDHMLATAREETLRNERIIALGTMAAGAAHELGTPLSTIAVISKELQRDFGDNPELIHDLQIMRTQVEECKHIISDLLASAGTTRLENGIASPLDKQLERIIDKWLLVRPNVNLTTRYAGEQPAPAVIIDHTLDQALMNLFNNAADVSPDNVEVECAWSAKKTIITILDRGPGLSEEALRNVGNAFFTTKSPDHGMGIGLFLANATIERFGGEVRWFNREAGGAITEVTLPLNMQKKN